MSDKERILKIINQYGPALVDDKPEFQRYIKDGVWNRSVMGVSQLKDLIALEQALRRRWEELYPQPLVPEDNREKAPKIDIEVNAKGVLHFSVTAWGDEYRIESDNNKYSQLVAFEITFRALKMAVEGEAENLKNKKPGTEGMTKSQWQKHIDALDILTRYRDAQFLELREEMVAIKKKKLATGNAPDKPKKQKSNLVIASANTPLPRLKKQ